MRITTPADVKPPTTEQAAKKLHATLAEILEAARRRKEKHQ